MTRELDFVFASVRRYFDPAWPIPPIDCLDWGKVLDLAQAHSVTGFLRRACENPALAPDALVAAQYTLAISAELAKLARILEEAKISVIALKGPVLGAALYQDEALKTSTDLDFLVRPQDALRTKGLLEEKGYRLHSVPHWPSERGYLRNVNGELSFSDPKDWLKLDLHWSLLPSYFPAPFEDIDVWSRARPVRWGGAKVNTLCPEHQLMFLCAHGAKHFWARLGWLCDLARLIRVEPDINWVEVLGQTRRSRTTRMVLLGLALADDLLGVTPPAAVAELVVSDRHIASLVATVLGSLRRGRTPSSSAVTKFCVQALERPGQRTKLLWGMVKPTEAEYKVVQMPASLYWLYYLFRPLRLGAKHVRRLSGF